MLSQEKLAFVALLRVPPHLSPATAVTLLRASACGGQTQTQRRWRLPLTELGDRSHVTLAHPMPGTLHTRSILIQPQHRQSDVETVATSVCRGNCGPGDVAHQVCSSRRRLSGDWPLLKAVVLSPKRSWEMSGDMGDCHGWGRACYWYLVAEAKEATGHLENTQGSHTTRNYPA